MGQGGSREQSNAKSRTQLTTEQQRWDPPEQHNLEACTAPGRKVVQEWFPPRPGCARRGLVPGPEGQGRPEGDFLDPEQ